MIGNSWNSARVGYHLIKGSGHSINSPTKGIGLQ